MAGIFNFRNLDSTIRALMTAEVDLDTEASVLYLSSRFNAQGNAEYPRLLRQAIEDHDDVWLGEMLLRLPAFNEYEVVSGRQKAVPRNAHTVFSSCEFNRFYIRALCSLAVDKPNIRLIVYRARESSIPRPESEIKIGTEVDARALLEDLRQRTGTYTYFGLPEVNSGLSLEIVGDE